MKFASVFFLCCLAGVVGRDIQDKGHPVEKVITLLKKLKADAIAEGQTEEVSYGKFTYWCSTSIADLKKVIAEGEETIDELKDTIAGKQKEQASLEEAIQKLEDEIGKLQASAKSAKDDRDDGEKLYDKVSADLGSTIKAIEDCIVALQEAEATTEGGGGGGGGGGGELTLLRKRVRNLLAFVSVKTTDQQLRTLVNFAEDPAKPRPEQLAAGDLEKHTDKYDFKSESVIELLKQLKLKFEDDKTEATEDETNAVNAHQLSKKARDNAIKAAEDSKTTKDLELAAVKDALTTAKSDLKNAEDDLDADSKSLASTTQSCTTKANEWQKRSKTRALEIEAMDMAVEILGKVTGVRTTAPSNPTLPASPVTFLQVSKSSPKANLKKMKAVELLRKTAKELHSNALERLGLEVSNHLNGPFDTVNNMVQKMIFRLMDEQKQEDEHKLWCDQEIAKTNAMKDNKDTRIENLKAEIDLQKGKVNKLTEDIKDANEMVAAITSFMKEATEIRNTGKGENKLAIKDAQEAQTAIANGVAVLTAFYKESGMIEKEGWELIQKEPASLSPTPSTWDSSYSGVADPKAQPKGIITILEALNADFATMEADTRAQEEVDQKEFEQAIKEHDIERARRSKESEMKSAEKARRVDKIATLESSKKDTEAALEKTEQYLKDLRPACVDGDSTYEDRKAARAKEVKALQNAQDILADAFKEKEGGSSKFLQIKRHL